MWRSSIPPTSWASQRTDRDRGWKTMFPAGSALAGNTKEGGSEKVLHTEMKGAPQKVLVGTIPNQPVFVSQANPKR